MSRSPIRNLGIIAHIDAGKTTLTERMLYYSHKERRIGEVDHGTATLDWMPEEQRRGITIGAAATSFDWGDCRLQLIDTPGHVDFTSEVERALRVLDGAVGVFCGVSGVQAQTETVWRQADRHGVPRLAFVNKMDRVGADLFRVVEDIEERLRVRAVPLYLPIGSGPAFEGVVDLVERQSLRFEAASLGERVLRGTLPSDLVDEAELWREQLVEAACEADEGLFEIWASGAEVSTERLRQAIRRGVVDRALVPVFCGAALCNQGVQPLLDGICQYLPSPEEVGPLRAFAADGETPVELERVVDGPLCALAFKTEVDAVEDLTWVRIYSGRVRAGEQVFNARTGQLERIEELARLHANHREPLREGRAGDILAVTGFREVATGDTLSGEGEVFLLERPVFPQAVISRAVEPSRVEDQPRLTEALEKLAREDPSFSWRRDVETGQILLSGMGELHLEVVGRRLEDDFRIEVQVGRPRVAYRQTVAARAEHRTELERPVEGRRLRGCVRVEVLPSSADVLPVVDDALGGRGPPDELRAVALESLREALETGGTVGLPVTRLRARLHEVSASDDEQSAALVAAATVQALESALSQGGIVVLEPRMRFSIEVPDEFCGAVSHDLARRKATIDEVGGGRDLRTLRGTVALSETFGYSVDLRSLTQGRASWDLTPESYLPVSAEVAARLLG